MTKQEKKTASRLNYAVCLKAKITPSFSPIESLKILSINNVHTVVSDTFLLLNQERLKRVLGEDTFSAYIKGLSNPVAKPASIPMTDKDRLSTIRSRYCQSPSEIMAWTEVLSDRWMALKQKYEQQVAAQQQQESQQTNTNQTTPQ